MSDVLSSLDAALAAKRCPSDVKPKYRDAWIQGVEDARRTIRAHGPFGYENTQTALRKLTGSYGVVSGNRRDAYDRAVRSAMSMVKSACGANQ